MNVRADLIKLLIFTTIGVLIAALLYVTLGQTQIGPSRSYVVMMRDVSGLESGDLVRVAGVRVGQVDSVQVEGNDDNEVRVGFHVDSKQPVTTATDVLVRFENLLGDRYLELQQEPGQGSALKAGAVIPVSRTTPALDLDTLLNGFRPLFRGLEPQQINEFATNLISTLQGQGGTVQALLQQVGSFTNGLADDDKVIGELITNMNDLLGSLDDRDTELRTTISSFRNLVSGLAKDRDPIATSVTGIDAMTAQLSDLFTRVRGPFKSTVISVQRLAQLLNTNTTTLQKVIDQLPEAYRLLDRVGSHGNFFNFYLCSAQVQISGPNGKPIKTPVVRSQVKRCNA